MDLAMLKKGLLERTQAKRTAMAMVSTTAKNLPMALIPNKSDSDADGFSDGEESIAQTDPLSAQENPEGRGRSPQGVVADTTNDTDNDGLSDAEEGLAGTNPSKADAMAMVSTMAKNLHTALIQTSPTATAMDLATAKNMLLVPILSMPPSAL